MDLDGILHDRKPVAPAPRDSSGTPSSSQKNRRRISKSNNSSSSSIVAQHSGSSSNLLAGQHSSSNLYGQHSSSSGNLARQHSSRSSYDLAEQHSTSSGNIAAQRSSGGASNSNITEQYRPQQDDGYFFASPNSAPSPISEFLNYPADSAGGKDDGRRWGPASGHHHASTGTLSFQGIPATTTTVGEMAETPPAGERTRLLRPVSSMLSLPGALSNLKRSKSLQPPQVPQTRSAAAAAAAVARAAPGAAAARAAAGAAAARGASGAGEARGASGAAAAPSPAAGASRERERRSKPLGEIKMELKGANRTRGLGSMPRFPSFGSNAASGSNLAVGFSRRKAPIAPALRYLMEVMCTDLIACGECFVPDDKAGQTLVRYCGFVPIEVDEALDWETSHFLGDDHDEAYGRGVGLPGIAWAASKPRVVEISTLTTDLSFDTGGKRWVFFVENVNKVLCFTHGT